MATINKLCSPALIYLVFALTQIIIDIFKSLYSQAFFKFIQMIFFTLLLNILCTRGLGIVSWIIVFIPFILMTVITGILMVVFGLDPASGDYTVDVDESKNNKEDNVDNNSNNDSDSDSDSDSGEDDYNKDDNNKDTDNDNDNSSNDKEIIIINPESSKAYKIEGLNNKESNEPQQLNITSPNQFIKNITKRI